MYTHKEIVGLTQTEIVEHTQTRKIVGRTQTKKLLDWTQKLLDF